LDDLALEVGLTGAAKGVTQGRQPNVLLDSPGSIGDGHDHGAQAVVLAVFEPLRGQVFLKTSMTR
jgi:hypothetical protein